MDVAIISEGYRGKTQRGDRWRTDITGLAALWACGQAPFGATPCRRGVGYVHGEIGGVHIFSCYFSPNEPLKRFEDALTNLVREARTLSPLVIAGDFNAWATQWGSRFTNQRGRALVDALAVLDVVLANEGNIPTFTGTGAGSIVDLTFVSPTLYKGCGSWRVSQEYTGSDHQAILFEVRPVKRLTRRKEERLGSPKWNARDLDEKTFIEALGLWRLGAIAPDANPASATDCVRLVLQWLSRACDATMRTGGGCARGQPAYWWSDTIAALRKRCLSLRRQYTRARKQGPSVAEEFRLVYAEARRVLRKEIAERKRSCWRELCAELDADPWGRAYKIATKRMRRSQPKMEEAEVSAIVKHLFPSVGRVVLQLQEEVDVRDIPPVTPGEVLGVCQNFGANKSPGLDRIPNLALKAAVRTVPAAFTEMYDRCLREGIFPDVWKRQRLVLIQKPGKPPGDPSSYRPLCMLDTAGKMLEKIIQGRLREHVDPDLTDNQYGFRPGRSSTDAVEEVRRLVMSSIGGPVRRRKLCLMATLDVKNAFNSARWNKIWEALHRDFNIPGYLMRIINSYLSDRVLYAETTSGVREFAITAGVPQGSVLGPDLWNILYNGLLKLPMPEGCRLVAYADDVAVLIPGIDADDIADLFGDVMDTVHGWMESADLSLAVQKTEMVLFTGRKVRTTIELTYRGHTIRSQPAIRYLGVMLDQRMNFKEHLRCAGNKAATTVAAISRILPNVGGPRGARRRVLACVGTSILLYAAPIWAEAADVPAYQRLIAPAHRTSALRIACAYRTVSGDAAQVIAGLPPIDLLATERMRQYRRKKGFPEDPLCDGVQQQHDPASERAYTINEWQRRWDASGNGRWTHLLIPRIEPWISRKHGEVNYHLTQILTGHGGFREYLHRIGAATTPDCPSCPGITETAKHVLLECPRFEQDRRRLECITGSRVTVAGYVASMLRCRELWDAGCVFAAGIMRTLGLQEEADRKRGRGGVGSALSSFYPR